MEKRETEFRLLEKQAINILKDETEPNKTHKSYVIYVLVMPSFGDFMSWVVFSDAHETTFILRKTVWWRGFDNQRFRDPMTGLKYGWNTDPTISSAITDLPPTAIANLLSTAQSLNIPNRIRKSAVLDGTRWFVFVKRAFDNKSYDWNDIDVPRGWEPLVKWTGQFITVLDGFVSIEDKGI